jgi:hypothetical protein
VPNKLAENRDLPGSDSSALCQGALIFATCQQALRSQLEIYRREYDKPQTKVFDEGDILTASAFMNKAEKI